MRKVRVAAVCMVLILISWDSAGQAASSTCAGQFYKERNLLVPSGQLTDVVLTKEFGKKYLALHRKYLLCRQQHGLT